MSKKSKLAAVAFPFLAACAGPQIVAVPDSLKPDAGESVAMIVPAKGVQIYQCRATTSKAGYEWAFVAPQAELYDASGARIGKHYAGPSWEAHDGSRIVGAVKERADAPAAGAIPWLLLTTKSAGQGAFSGVTSVQRVNTVGGLAPSEGCSQATAYRWTRIGYTADYYFFTRK